MKITVNLFAGLENFTDFGKRKGNEIEIEDKATIKELLEILNIPAEKASLIMINGKHQDKEYNLKPDDNVSLFPSIGGG